MISSTIALTEPLSTFDFANSIHCSFQYINRDVAAAQVVLLRGCAAVGQTVKMFDEGKFIRTPVIPESHCCETERSLLVSQP
ncbi:hypothetical protein [Nostoc sp. JL33]|uniref:hypothetical protein n=1 Tax=Nostoc sp. JL33 TaxID=2815396 RepID=UPI0025F68C65|nr:hypothetical protein [Nostoc sp. JL33]MBN3869481.1 hypothetical protein [Nostoc sp. JL33]